MKNEMIEKAREIVEEMELDSKYGYIGIRVQEEPFELGEMDHVSHIWDNGDDTGVELDGICVCSLDRLGVNNYFGDHVAIICGNEAEYGEDDGEKELLVGQPHDELYLRWLEAQIDYHNMEYDSFNNSNAVFDAVFSSFRNAYNQSHMPKGTRKIYY